VSRSERRRFLNEPRTSQLSCIDYARTFVASSSIRLERLVDRLVEILRDGSRDSFDSNRCILQQREQDTRLPWMPRNAVRFSQVSSSSCEGRAIYARRICEASVELFVVAREAGRNSICNPTTRPDAIRLATETLSPCDSHIRPGTLRLRWLELGGAASTYAF